MKKIIISSILSFVFAISIMAQSIPDPEFSSQVYILQEDDTYKNLEKTDAQIDIKIKGLGYGGSEIYLSVFTPKSKLRFKSKDLPKLIIKIEDNIDPSELVSLSMANIKRKRRSFLQSSMTFSGKARSINSSYIKLDFKKVRDSIYEIILPANIQLGEYAFMPIVNSSHSYKTTAKIYCFGID